MLVRIVNRKTLIRCQNQSDLSLPRLSRPFWQETSFQNFITSGIGWAILSAKDIMPKESFHKANCHIQG